MVTRNFVLPPVAGVFLPISNLKPTNTVKRIEATQENVALQLLFPPPKTLLLHSPFSSPRHPADEKLNTVPTPSMPSVTVPTPSMPSVTVPTPSMPSVTVSPMNAALLTPQGRFLFDFFLYKTTAAGGEARLDWLRYGFWFGWVGGAVCGCGPLSFG
ncbi:hypothetical protein SLEP1_g46075 [Rubroshorea leprosula]|uniref:Uncharacterized protein n=1 Tax=Rubroshorea leprosula TaxID=152421 RepID=A0AAV5LLZ1_9ROSI|nr:hypothetical protein SLEP1_g46075 [Rubroshorea leprosula]